MTTQHSLARQHILMESLEGRRLLSASSLLAAAASAAAEAQLLVPLRATLLGTYHGHVTSAIHHSVFPITVTISRVTNAGLLSGSGTSHKTPKPFTMTGQLGKHSSFVMTIRVSRTDRATLNGTYTSNLKTLSGKFTSSTGDRGTFTVSKP
jgi:hypothetical protein